MKHITSSQPQGHFVRVSFALAIALSLISVFAGTGPVSASSSPPKHKSFSINYHGHPARLYEPNSTTPPTDAQCRQQYGIPCYSPQEMRTAYDLNPILNAGYDGTGQTIIIIDSFGSPTIKSDLKTFDAGYGLPDPPSFKILHPVGSVPFNPNDGTMVSWAVETSLDVEWAHAMAPGANIVLMTSPVAETQGVMGMPKFLHLEKYALDHHLGNIISQSWATTENTLFANKAGKIVLKDFEAFYQQAAQDNVTVFASSGDTGVANPDVNGQIYPFPTVNFPASSPYVTAVGGTSLYADTQGNYQSENGWSGSGGGISQYFAEPDYEVNYLPPSIQSQLNNHRGLPDISYNADPSTSILYYASFIPGQSGYYFVGGTSEGSPQWAGIIADANDFAGYPLGFLNPKLYALGAGSQYNTLYHDILVGNNSNDGIQGYNCGPGWDFVTGWGTLDAAQLIHALVGK
ncbi:MAG TPA: S53 family peptidase [Ktedonobacteraceae bacterium]|nr:S53 family peptidase [Ktedonobacteraceae bacterium]